MKVDVITRHAPSNYGSLLQALATVKVIEKMGHDCEIIDYIRPDELGMKALMNQLHNKPNYNNNIIKKIAYILLRYPDEKRAELAFLRMREKYLKMTDRFSSMDKLKSLCADVYMTGSDQVWGPAVDGKHDKTYFLDFVDNKTKCIAYSASFGRTEIPNSVIKEYKEMLSKYSGIAVREKSAVELLDSWGIPNVEQVLDPVFLMSKQEWSEYIDHSEQGQYVLVYQIHNDPNLNEYAKSLAAEKGLPLKRVSAFMRQIFRGGHLVCLPDISEFLALIKGCTYFVTDSFHGTAFAMIFNRQFMEVLPNNNTGTRNLNILSLVGLENRIVRSKTDINLIESPIDYTKVNEILEHERARSLDILRKMLEN